MELTGQDGSGPTAAKIVLCCMNLSKLGGGHEHTHTETAMVYP